MRINPEGKIGLFLGLIGVFGAGAPMIWPESKLLGWALLSISGIGFVWLAIHHWGAKKDKASISLKVGENDLLKNIKSKIWGHQKTFLVRVDNETEDKSIVNGQLQILSISPYVGSNGPWFLKRDISINPGTYDPIPFIEYSESGKLSVSAATAANVLTVDHRPQLLVENGKYEIKLHMSADNMPPAQLTCEIWFDNHVMHIKDISKPE